MKIKAESRDIKNLNKNIRNYVIGIIFFGIVYIFSMILGGVEGGLFYIPFAILTIGIIPIIIRMIRKANKLYNESWTTEEYELELKDNHLYLDDNKLTINMNDNKNIIYLHNLGYNGNPYKASIYLTVEGEDQIMLKDYIAANGIKVDKEYLPRGKGRYGFAAPMSITRYRRK